MLLIFSEKLLTFITILRSENDFENSQKISINFAETKFLLFTKKFMKLFSRFLKFSAKYYSFYLFLYLIISKIIRNFIEFLSRFF